VSALEKIRVLDFGRYIAGPWCATLLAEFGADVIRVERRGGGEDRSLAPVTDEGDGVVFLQANRNKRSLTLDQRKPEAQAIVDRLVASADMVVVNMPVGALEKAGLDYQSLRKIRPDIILVNVSSFGSRGPWAERPGFDSIGQAMSGAAYLTGPGDRPYRMPITWVDNATATYAAFGAMVALFERAVTGRGQQVEGSLVASALAVSSTYVIEEALLGLGRTPIGNLGYMNGPTDTFRTRDGWIVTQVIGPSQFRRCAELIGEPGWLDDPRFSTDALRAEHGADLSERVAVWCRERTSEEALDVLAQAGIPAGPVLSPAQTLDHPQVQALDLFTPTAVPGLDRTVPLARAPVELSETPGQIRRPPPRIGEHTDEILRELGFSAADIDGFRSGGVI
jgi:crotonobetainyl-CoA:carnitine CoA-transferase CaiB-like acyl-CoA transferase